MPNVLVVLTSCKNNWLKKCNNYNNNGNMLYIIFIYLGIKVFAWYGKRAG